MTYITIGVDKTEGEMLAYVVSDDAVKAVAGKKGKKQGTTALHLRSGP